MTGLDHSTATYSAGQLRPGLRVYAIGDIHGHADLLGRVSTMIATDLEADRPAETLTVFIGDYIDRGPSSAAVVDRLLRRDFPTPIVTLRGNHEQMLLDALDDAALLRSWLSNGGLETARSYGLSTAALLDGDPEWFRRELLDVIPAAHLALLRSTELSRTVDGYFFCHAGIEPGVALDEQAAETLMWIRRPFHLSKLDHGKVVVHGHTPVPKPEVKPNRINIDTGAFASGRLTCLVLDGAKRRFMST